MYDTRFTTKEIAENAHISRKLLTVTTPEGNELCYVCKAKICDLNGEQIAAFSRKEKRVENDKKVSVRVYESECGEFVVKENYLYLGDEFLGVMPVKKRLIPLIILFFLLGCLLAASVVTFVLMSSPKDKMLVIDVKDENGAWKAQGTVAVLDDVLYPDTDGVYNFIIRNANDAKLLYDFSIAESYNGKVAKPFPLEYRVRVNNDLIGSEEWLKASELHFEDLIFLAQSEYLVTIEWRWPFESGNDALDTEFGRDAGQYSLQLTLTAEQIGGTP